MSADARQLGLEALRAGNFADAAKHLSGFISSAPNDNEARLAFALALSGRGDHDKALIHLDKLLTKTPNSASLHFHRGQILERAKRIDQAKREFRRVLELDPKHLKAQAKLQAPAAPPGFEVIDDEPQFEVVEDDNEMRVAEAVDEDLVEARFVEEGDDVIEAEVDEEVWDKKGKKLDIQSIAKYVVLILAVVGAAVFGFFMFTPTLGVVFTLGIGLGAILLGVADYLNLGGEARPSFWLLHLFGLVSIIATVVGVMIGHRMNQNDEVNRELGPFDRRPKQSLRSFPALEFTIQPASIQKKEITPHHVHT